MMCVLGTFHLPMALGLVEEVEDVLEVETLVANDIPELALVVGNSVIDGMGKLLSRRRHASALV